MSTITDHYVANSLYKARYFFGQILEVRTPGAEPYRGVFLGGVEAQWWDDGEWFGPKYCVMPLDAAPGRSDEFRMLPSNYLVRPEHTKWVDSGRGDAQSLEEFMRTHRSKKAPKLRTLPTERVVKKSGHVRLGDRVTIEGLPGQWLVISLAPAGIDPEFGTRAVAQVHVQCDTGEHTGLDGLRTVAVKRCALV